MSARARVPCGVTVAFAFGVLELSFPDQRYKQWVRNDVQGMEWDLFL